MKTLIAPNASGIVPGLAFDPPQREHLTDATHVLFLNTVNPSGGRGGSLDSDECADLVRTLASIQEHPVIVATQHRSADLMNANRGPGRTHRILGPEMTSILLAHSCVIAWVAGDRQQAQTKRHGLGPSGLWEFTPNAMESGWRRLITRLRRER